jgi:hypothetical protein
MFGFGKQQNVGRKNRKSPVDRQHHRQARTGYEKRLRFEPLEDRQLLSVFTVTNPNDGTVTKAGDLPGSLRQAIFDANANPGADTINFASSLSGDTITMTAGQLAITDALTITGLGATNLAINGNNQSRIFKIDDGSSATNINVEIDGLTLTGGNASGTQADGAGGAIFSFESLTIKNSTITGNKAASRAGGVYSWGYAGGATTIQNCTISNNTAKYGGGIWTSTATASTAPVLPAATMTIQGSTISGNTATNTSGNGGGGIYSYKNYGTTLIQGSTISGNTSQDPVSQKLTKGGGILMWKNFGTLTVDSDIVSGNTGSAGGGISLRNSNAGVSTVENSTISGNNSDLGGGLFLRSADGTVVLQNSTISGNNATGKGGGIYTANYTSITIQNSTITGNTSHGGGGGIFINPPTLKYYTGAAVDIHSTIISGNTDVSGTTPDVSKTTYVYTDPTTQQPTTYTIVNFDHSLVGNNAGSDLTAAPVGSPDTNGNLVGTSTAPIDPKLAPLANNDGPTPTYALLKGSPAIDMGANPASLTTDQRGSGFLRAVGGLTDIGAYEYQLAVTGISPAQGPVTGGTQVTITGADFTGATAVFFGTTKVTSFTVNSDTQITVTSPAGTGVVDMTVTTPSGTSPTVSADKFSYTAVVTGLSTQQGPATGGTPITISGAGFTGATAVNFGATTTTAFTVVTDTQITVTSPAGAGLVDVTVTAATGTSPKSSADQFAYIPVIVGINPGQGPATGGKQVTITGAGFTGATAVSFGSTKAATFTVVSDTQITVPSPAGTGVVHVTVTTAGGTSATLAADQFSYTPAVTAITPIAGAPAGGTKVTITGAGFTSATEVDFGNTKLTATSFTVDSDTQITATSPAGTGLVDVTVTTPTGTSATSSADQFSYAPVVTAISPAQGPAVGGTQVTITGENFTGATAVYFGTTLATGVTVNSAGTQITATSPAGTGLVDVTVVTGGGTSVKSPADLFGYPAVVTGISPAQGPASGGTQVTITGTNLTGATAVMFGGNSATIQSNTGAQIVVIAPAGTAGTVDVTVTTAGGTSATSAADHFAYVAAPVVTKISPTQGSATGGTQVTITGTDFTGTTAVYFGTTLATGVTVNSAGTQITATGPAGTGVVDVTVVTVGGTSAKSSADLFGYSAVVTGISPAQGPASGGTQVTITGTNLTGATAVKFGGSTATIKSNTDTQIVVITSAGTGGTVDVTVTTTGGTSATSSADQFTYVAAPAVTGLSPSSEPVAGGMQVTITGTSLAGATTVKFGGSTATIKSATDTQIVVTVPAGTTGTVDVTVVTVGGTSAIVAADQFTYYQSGTCAIGLYNPTASVFYLRNSDSVGYSNSTFAYGATNSGFTALVGDWDGNGTETVGLYDPIHSVFYLSNSNSSQFADDTFVYGPANSGDIPIVGDWDANGTDTVGLYDPKTSTFYLRNSNTSGFANIAFVYGPANSGLTPLVGDWYGGGMDTIGLYSPTTSTFYLRNSNTSGFANVTFTYGGANNHWTPIVGDWNGDGKDSIGLYDPTASVFYLKNTNEGGFATTVFTYGAPNTGWKPIVGAWMGDAKSLMAADAVAASANGPTLTQEQLTPIVNEAIAQWSSAGLSAAEVQKLRQVQFVVSDLSGSQLGEATGDVIYLDANAAGNGWFVDATPAPNEEFSSSAGTQQLRAVDPRALDRIDLLTVVEHELGHVLGLNDLNALADDVMDGVLGTGVRRVASHVDAALAS